MKLYFTFWMANSRSQTKRIERSEREREENLYYKSGIKTYFKRVEAALAEGDREKAGSEYRGLLSKIDKAVIRGTIHSNSAARKKSRAAKLMQ